MAPNELKWKIVKPPAELTDFVESFWMLDNHSDKEHQMIILPDGRVDIIFSLSPQNVFQGTLKGLDTEPGATAMPAHTRLFSISFKLLAIDYLIDFKIPSLLNEGIRLPADFWGISQNDLTDFNAFCKKVSATLISRINPDIDERKRKLFDLIYSSNGTLTIKELSEKVFWSSRQINRYFNQTFGISLKSYCTIFRFKSALQFIKNGQLYPNLNFTDQSHFIKEVKKMSGVTPKELSKNENDRFILFSTLAEE